MQSNYLGLEIVSQLEWDKHIDTVKTEANRFLGPIMSAKKYLPSYVLIKMHRGIFEPHLSYCCSAWGCCSESKISALQKVQNRAARIVTNSPCDASTAPLIQKLGWSTFSILLKNESATLIYKSLNSFPPDYLKKLFIKCSDDNGFCAHQILMLRYRYWGGSMTKGGFLLALQGSGIV